MRFRTGYAVTFNLKRKLVMDGLLTSSGSAFVSSLIVCFASLPTAP